MNNIPAHLKAKVRELLDERFYPFDWVESEIAANRIGVMHNEAAVIGFETRQYPGGATEVHGLFAAGDLEAILALIDDVTAGAGELGITVAAIESRGGWQRALKSRGFKQDRVRLVKELG